MSAVQSVALGDSFAIRDEHNVPVYHVAGRGFAWGKKLSFQDDDRRELLFIMQKSFCLRPTFHLLRNGELMGVVERKLLTLWGRRFTVRLNGEPDLRVDGDSVQHEFVFTRSGQVVGRVSKKWFTLGDSYGVGSVRGKIPS